MKTTRLLPTHSQQQQARDAELRAAASRLPVYDLENLAFTEHAAPEAEPPAPAAKRFSALLSAFVNWVMSRL